MDYVDLLLLHRPTTLEEHERCLDVVMKLQEAGKVNHFGVSNFTLAQLEHAWNYTGGRIFTNQIEYHPCLSQERIKGFCDEKGIKITAYSPLGQGNLLKNQILQSLADKH
jgi:2,5-diketo-D-gluconate reductase B